MYYNNEVTETLASSHQTVQLTSGESLTLYESGFYAGSIRETAFLMTLKS
jgi:hypothetical protein